LRKLRIVLFVTSHITASHHAFLVKCWPHAVRNSALLMQVETVIFFAARMPIPAALDAFTGKNVTVKLYRNPGYQTGAIIAMDESTSKGWFAGYDWMIRTNPDVLILNDTFLIQHMLNPEVDGIFADCFDRPCLKHCTGAHICTDFFAVRVAALPNFAQIRMDTAEEQANHAFKHMISSGRDRFMQGTSMHGICRIKGRSDIPVLHAHSLVNQCPLRKGEPHNRNIG